MALRLKGSYGLALLVTTGIVGWMATGHAVFSGQEKDNSLPPPAVRNQQTETEATRVAVTTFSVEPMETTLTIRGRTEADTKVTVRSETTAIIRARPIEKGQWVNKGTLMCELDVGSREAALARAEAALAQAELDYQAKAALSKKGYASDTQLAAVKAQRDAALVGTKEARLELDRIRILAPISGIVEGAIAEVGDQLKAGDACATLMQPDPMLVVGQVSERDIAQVKKGATAHVRLVTGEELEGTVRYVSPASDIETRTFLVEVEIPNEDRALRDGVTAEARLDLEPVMAHHMSPAHLTLSDDGLVGVMLVQDGKAHFAPVSILSNDTGGMWLGGLPQEAQVITVGQEYVQDGQPVEIVKTPANELASSERER